MTREEILKKLVDLRKIHYDSTTPMDAYHTGMYNGIEVAISILCERMPEYKDVEEVKRAYSSEDLFPANLTVVGELTLMSGQDKIRDVGED